MKGNQFFKTSDTEITSTHTTQSIDFLRKYNSKVFTLLDKRANLKSFFEFLKKKVVLSLTKQIV